MNTNTRRIDARDLKPGMTLAVGAVVTSVTSVGKRIAVRARLPEGAYVDIEQGAGQVVCLAF